MDEQLMERKVASEVIYDGKVVHLEKWRVELPNGAQANREIIRHVGAAAVLPVDENGMATMVRQWRAALGTVTLEIPAGKFEKTTDDPLESAQRELSEETGITAANWRHLTKIFTSVGFCDERIDLYLATGLTQGATHPDDDEFLEIVKIPFAELHQMAIDGRIVDAKSVVAITLASNYLKKRDNS